MADPTPMRRYRAATLAGALVLAACGGGGGGGDEESSAPTGTFLVAQDNELIDERCLGVQLRRRVADGEITQGDLVIWITQGGSVPSVDRAATEIIEGGDCLEEEPDADPATTTSAP